MKQDIMAHQSSSESDDQIPSSHPLDSSENNNPPHPSKDHFINMEEQQQQELQEEEEEDPSASNTLLCSKDEIALQGHGSVAEDEEGAIKEGEDSGRERLKRHRVEVAGRVWIPERWGQEELLKDWIDCSAFDAPLVPSRITTARAALVQQDTRANAAALRIHNSKCWPSRGYTSDNSS